MSHKLNKWYFKSRSFERRQKGIIYVRLGARIYKKFVPTSGDLITRLRGINRLKIVETGNRRQALENYQEQTRKWEWRHLISAVLLESWAVFAGIAFGIEHFFISSTINLFVNLYPIMVQRYNRARIAQVLSKIEY